MRPSRPAWASSPRERCDGALDFAGVAHAETECNSTPNADVTLRNRLMIDTFGDEYRRYMARDLAHLAGHLLAAAPLLHAGVSARAALWAPVSCSILCTWATAWRAASLCVNRSSFSVSSSDTGVSA